MTEREFLINARRTYWRALLRRHRWCITQASAEAGINRTDAYNIFRGLGLQLPGHRIKPYGVSAPMQKFVRSPVKRSSPSLPA